MRSELATFTNMCMIYDGDYILVQERKGSTWEGVTFPGGHVEAEESFIDSTIREVKEETGLDVSQLELCGLKQFTTKETGRYVVVCYKTNVFCGEVCSNEEGRLFWIHKDELKNYKLSEGFMEMYQLFVSDRSEHFNFKESNEWKFELK